MCKADQELLCSPVYITYLAAMGVTVVAMLLVYRKGSQKLAYAPVMYSVCNDLAAGVQQGQRAACVRPDCLRWLLGVLAATVDVASALEPC